MICSVTVHGMVFQQNLVLLDWYQVNVTQQRMQHCSSRFDTLISQSRHNSTGLQENKINFTRFWEM